MIVTRVSPGVPDLLDLEAPGSRDQLLEWYRPPRPDWLRINLVVSVNGSAAGSDGTSESLTSAADRRILGVIRELADAVLVGAASVRAEGYQVPKRSRLAILTRTGDLVGHRLDDAEPGRLIVLGPATALDRARAAVPNAEFITVDSESAADAIVALRGAGHRSLVCEGGPGLAGQLVAAGVVDELCLTTSPRLTTGRLVPLAGDLPEIPLQLAQLMLGDDGSLFARWIIRAD